MRRVFALIAAAVLAAALVIAPATPAAADSICGNELNDWVPVASTWDVEAFVNGDPQTSVLALTQLGQVAVTTVVDPLGVYQGQYAHIPASNELDWYAVDIPNAGPRLTYFATALSCDSLDRVITAGGPVVQYAVGQVGIFYATRILL